MVFFKEKNLKRNVNGQIQQFQFHHHQVHLVHHHQQIQNLKRNPCPLSCQIKKQILILIKSLKFFFC